MRDGADILLGIGSGTFVVKAVAFDLVAHQVAAAAVLNRLLRLTGSATRSRTLRGVLAASMHAPVRVSSREEAGAARAARMAAVAVGAYAAMEGCSAQWVTPLLDPLEQPDPQLVSIYDRLFPAYVQARVSLAPLWDAFAGRRDAAPARLSAGGAKPEKAPLDAMAASEGSAI